VTNDKRYFRVLYHAVCAVLLVGATAAAYAFLAPRYSAAPTAYRPAVAAVAGAQQPPTTDVPMARGSERVARIDTRVSRLLKNPM
jgi:hypothetical protein